MSSTAVHWLVIAVGYDAAKTVHYLRFVLSLEEPFSFEQWRAKIVELFRERGIDPVLGCWPTSMCKITAEEKAAF